MMRAMLLCLAMLVGGCGMSSVIPLPELPAPRSLKPTVPEEARKTVAVLYFDNNAGEERYDPLVKGLADMMITDLSAIETIRLVERERLEDLRQELVWQQSAYVDSTTALEMGRFIGAEYVITGAVTVSRPTLRIDTRVVEVETSRIVEVATVTGQEDRFFRLQQELAEALIEGLDVTLSPEQQRQFQARQQANRINDLDMVVLYGEALDRLDQEDYVAAFARMYLVVEAVPQSTILRATLEELATKAATRMTRNRIRDLF